MLDERLSGIVCFDKEEYDDYRRYLSSRKEWPGLNIDTDRETQVTLSMPMLIMELFRLVPYKEDRYINFHPFNMPCIKVRKIELVGIVTNVRRDANNLFLTIEDGTGVVKVNYKLQQYLPSLKQREEIDKRYREQAENLRQSEKTRVIENCPKKFPKIRPKFSYSRNVCLQDVADLENKWWAETNGGLLGKEIEPLDYIHIVGYPCFDAKFQTIPQEITEEFIAHARVTAFAIFVTCISEETYNKKLLTWMDITRQRYREMTRKNRVNK